MDFDLDAYKKRIGKILSESSVKQDDFAKAFNIDRTTVSQYQRGRTPLPIHHLPTLSKMTGFSIQYLITGFEHPVLAAYAKLSGLPKDVVDRELFGEKKSHDSLEIGMVVHEKASSAYEHKDFGKK